MHRIGCGSGGGAVGDPLGPVTAAIGDRLGICLTTDSAA